MTKTPPIEFDDTRVDLGEDLLQTKTIQRPMVNPEPAPPKALLEETRAPEASADTGDEWVLNAKILRSEGLIEEAKKTLRKALIQDPSNIPAKRLLESIHADEVKALLSGSEGKRSSRLKRDKKNPLDTTETPDEILRTLESDLGLSGLDGEPFQSEQERADFLRKIDESMMGANPLNRLDFGIAFLEMGLPALARTQFQAAIRDGVTERTATFLLATCHILEGEPFPALLLLDPWVADPSHAPEEKLEVGYLMARAYEGLKRWEDAVIWYRSVVELDPEYRDALERLSRCANIRS